MVSDDKRPVLMSMGSWASICLYCSGGRKVSVGVAREHWIRMERDAGGYR